ncbi:MAG TPA: MFS transporter, partial [Burkholderiaceae bacterium]|nr:MFS transporter [Burkholderiaceae bacterium]
MDPPPEPSAPRRPLTALAATTAIQVWATVALTAPAVLAPVVAPLLDVPPERIGVFVGIAYLAAMFSGLVGSGFVPRHGGVAVSQFALLACATGLAIAPVGGLWMLPLAAVAIGIGYGLTNPSSAKILGEHAPPHRRGLLFSIKQSGVPIGVSITALLIPALLALTGWRVSVALLASVAVALALALLPARRRLESAARAPSPAPPAAA